MLIFIERLRLFSDVVLKPFMERVDLVLFEFEQQF